jgi:hypothetical protein
MWVRTFSFLAVRRRFSIEMSSRKCATVHLVNAGPAGKRKQRLHIAQAGELHVYGVRQDYLIPVNGFSIICSILSVVRAQSHTGDII